MPENCEQLIIRFYLNVCEIRSNCCNDSFFCNNGAKQSTRRGKTGRMEKTYVVTVSAISTFNNRKSGFHAEHTYVWIFKRANEDFIGAGDNRKDRSKGERKDVGK